MLMRVSNKINIVERTRWDFGLPEPLYVAEMHTLQAIGMTPDNNIGIIADLTGVTHSAASQVITKLAKRGLVQKVKGVRNDKEILLKLTPKGLIAYHNHEKIHAEKCDGLFKQIGPLSLEERATLERVFSSIDLFYTKSIEENSRAAAHMPSGDKQ
ncbi:MAG: MarR family winged helix-turn-helix transcriptional regulator [Methanoregula sp.]